MISVVSAQFYGGDKNIKKLVNQPAYDSVEYILYTNKPEAANDTIWKPVVIETEDPRMTARDIKINIHKHLPKSNYWLWLDANMEVKVDPNILVEKYMNNHSVCLMPHPERHHWFEEAQFLLARDQSLAQPLQELINCLYKEGFISNSLFETGVLLRKNNKDIEKLNEFWWDKVLNICIRDQVSFPYAAWKAGVAVNTFPGTNSVNPLRYSLKKYLPQWNEIIRAWN